MQHRNKFTDLFVIMIILILMMTMTMMMMMMFYQKANPRDKVKEPDDSVLNENLPMRGRAEPGDHREDEDDDLQHISVKRNSYRT